MTTASQQCCRSLVPAIVLAAVFSGLLSARSTVVFPLFRLWANGTATEVVQATQQATVQRTVSSVAEIAAQVVASLTAGPLADSFGRRNVVIGCIVAFSAGAGLLYAAVVGRSVVLYVVGAAVQALGSVLTTLSTVQITDVLPTVQGRSSALCGAGVAGGVSAALAGVLVALLVLPTNDSEVLVAAEWLPRMETLYFALLLASLAGLALAWCFWPQTAALRGAAARAPCSSRTVAPIHWRPREHGSHFAGSPSLPSSSSSEVAAAAAAGRRTGPSSRVASRAHTSGAAQTSTQPPPAAPVSSTHHHNEDDDGSGGQAGVGDVSPLLSTTGAAAADSLAHHSSSASAPREIEMTTLSGGSPATHHSDDSSPASAAVAPAMEDDNNNNNTNDDDGDDAAYVAEGQLSCADLTPCCTLYLACCRSPLLRAAMPPVVVALVAGSALLVLQPQLTLALGWADSSVALVLIALVLVAAIAAALSPAVVGCVGPTRTVRWGAITASLGFAVLIFAPAHAAIAITGGGITACSAFALPATVAVLTRLVDAEEQGRLQGAVSALGALAVAVGVAVHTALFVLGAAAGVGIGEAGWNSTQAARRSSSEPVPPFSAFVSLPMALATLLLVLAWLQCSTAVVSRPEYQARLRADEAIVAGNVPQQPAAPSTAASA